MRMLKVPLSQMNRLHTEMISYTLHSVPLKELWLNSSLEGQEPLASAMISQSTVRMI